ncbi:NTP transferase domain-containing protein [bacterium]|nr:NTP transferase domain-containing protein [bacterium]
MNIVMPMAGRGERFSQAGFETPKPLIEVDGIPMFVKATRSLPLALATRLIFIILEEHDNEYNISSIVEEYFSEYPLHIVRLPTVTGGQAETVKAGLSVGVLSDSLLVFNTDSAFEDDLELYFTNLEPEVEGMLQIFSDDQNRWSFVRTNESGRVLETAEKRVISKNASTGLYWFREATTFLRLKHISAQEGGESYIAPMYNQLVDEGGHVMAKPVKRFFCYGTPSDYKEATRNGVYYICKGFST